MAHFEWADLIIAAVYAVVRELAPRVVRRVRGRR